MTGLVLFLAVVLVLGWKYQIIRSGIEVWPYVRIWRFTWITRGTFDTTVVGRRRINSEQGRTGDESTIPTQPVYLLRLLLSLLFEWLTCFLG